MTRSALPRRLLAGFVSLFGTKWLTDQHFNNPEQGLEPAAIRANTAQASAWADLTIPTATLLVNLQLQLLATLDHEFGARYLPTFEPMPVFHSLFPDCITRKSGSARNRGAIRLPARRLLDMIGCARHYRKHGRWPAKAPAVVDAAKWMDVLPSELARWRMGRLFTLDDFDRIWDKMFNDYPAHSRPGTPTPLMFASVLLTRMFVLGSREQRNLSVAQGGAELYLDWWECQRAAAEACLDAARAGTDLWMPVLL